MPNMISTQYYFLCSIRSLSRVRRNLNNKLAANPSFIDECDSISTGDCILLYYLFGESYVLSHTDASTIKDVSRDISWANTLYSVVKKSNQVTTAKNRRITGSDSTPGRIIQYVHELNAFEVLI